MTICTSCDLYGPRRCYRHGLRGSGLSWSRPERHRCRVERLRTPPALLAPWSVLCKRCGHTTRHRTHGAALSAALVHASRTREVVV